MTSNHYRSLPLPGPECASFADLLPLLGEDTLDAQSDSRLRQHIGTCAYCQALVALDTRSASVFRRYFEPPALRLFSREELMQITDKEQRPAHTTEAGVSSPTPLRQRSGFSGRMRTLSAVAAIAAIVVLFVVLFRGFGPGHTGSQPGTPMTATPSPISNQALTNSLFGAPVIAPTDPQIIYQLVFSSATSTQVVLQRSTDGGANWHRFALPAQSSGPELSVFVSPLDAQIVFLSLGGTLVNNTCAPKPEVGSNSTLSGGGDVCVLQYLSRDGGAHWTALHLPSNEILNGLLPVDSIHTLQAQGTRLYAELIPSISPEYLLSSSGSTSLQLATSDDGGLTWQIVEKGLPLTTEHLCDVAPAPTGTTVFVMLGEGCPAGSASYALWRSDDAGAHWSLSGQLTGKIENGMAVVQSGNPALPLLYANMGCGGASAYLASRPDSGCGSGAPTDLLASADGGKTWQAAPAQGYPNLSQNPGRPLGVLSDGSVLFLVEKEFYTWRAGTASWKRVGPAVADGFQYALLTGTDTGHPSLWVVALQDSSTFTIKRYTL